MMQDELDKLSRSLDQLNAGQQPADNSPEIAELLEVAALLKQSDLPVAPPSHILDATVQRAASGLRAGRVSRTRWMYSGLLGAAASLLIFLSLQGLPEWRSTTLPLASTQPPAPAAQTIDAVPPATTTGSPAGATFESPPSVPPAVLAPVPQVPSAKSQSKPAETASAATPKLAARSAPVETYNATVPSALKPLMLPDRSPDSVSIDPASGALRQVFAAGTAQELVIVQRSVEFKINASPPPQQPRVHSDVKSAANQGGSQLNTVTVVIAGQEVTLSGRRTRQELLDIAASLKP